MKVLWLNHTLTQEACAALHLKASVAGGWSQAMLEALGRLTPNDDYCILSPNVRAYDVKVGRHRYMTFGNSRQCAFRKRPKDMDQQVKTLIQEFDPDVIHVQGTEWFYGGFDESVYCGKPVVVSLQGIVNACWPHYSGGLTPAELRWTNLNLRWLRNRDTILNNQSFWRTTWSCQEEKVFKLRKNFIGRTEWDRAWLDYLNPDAKYFTVHEIMRQPFYQVKRVSDKVVPHTIFCGGAAGYPLKGLHWLLKAIAALRIEFPDIQLRVAACSNRLSSQRSFLDKLKDDSYSIYLRRLIANLGLAKSVMCLPVLPDEEVAKELAHAELFVLPSLCENSPNSLCEAMLVGTPVVATFAGGIPSLVRDGVDGKLVQPYDPAALAAAIRHWFRFPQEADRCARSARSVALERHDPQKNAEATLKVYEELLR